VVELMYCDFIGRAGDELFNQVSKWQSMSAGLLTIPLTIRVSVGNKYGAQHSQDWTSLLAHIPGLKVMFPATPYDAKGMLNLALHGTDPVVFFESQRLYDTGELFVANGVPEGYYEVPEGEPIVRKEGEDVTIITVGAALYKGMEAAEELEKKYKVSAEVIDIRFINPLNYDSIIKSAKKTGKLVLVSDACERGSFLHTIASNISQFVFDYLDGPVVVVGARNWITPAAEMESVFFPFDYLDGPVVVVGARNWITPAAEMESVFFPQKEWIIDAIHEYLYPLDGHQVTTDQSTTEQIRRNTLGV